MDLQAVRRELRHQDGVVSRRQLLAAGLSPSDLDRLLRRKDLTRMLPGVFLEHTGCPTWAQRAWAGVLFYQPAVVAGPSALRGVGLWSSRDDVVHIGIDEDRRLRPTPGYALVRLCRFEERIHANTSPPRQRTEDALLDLAGTCPDDLTAIQMLADAVRARHTTAERLLRSLSGRSKQSRRRWLERVLQDLAEGTCSVLEHGYLVRVERAHGLPRAQRQAVEAGTAGTAVRDVHYVQYDMTVELNGRLFHDGPEDWDADLERELAAAVAGGLGLRLGWGQIFSRTCSTAQAVATILQARGWGGQPRACGADCTVTY